MSRSTTPLSRWSNTEGQFKVDKPCTGRGSKTARAKNIPPPSGHYGAVSRAAEDAVVFHSWSSIRNSVNRLCSVLSDIQTVEIQGTPFGRTHW